MRHKIHAKSKKKCSVSVCQGKEIHINMRKPHYGRRFNSICPSSSSSTSQRNCTHRDLDNQHVFMKRERKEEHVHAGVYCTTVMSP